MKKYIVGTAMFLGVIALPGQAFAAIAIGASLGGVTGTASTLSLNSLSISGDDRVILVAINYADNGATTVTSLNWDNGSGGNAESFAQIGSYQNLDSGTARVSLWYLTNPSTSNSRIILTNSNGTTGTRMAAVYYTGVAQSSTFTSPTLAVDGSSPGSQADTSDTDNSWHIGTAVTPNNGLTVGADTTQRVEQNDNLNIVDSNASVANTASHTLNWSWGSGDGAWITAMMRPAATTTPSDETLTGSGTLNRLAKFTATTTLASSLLSDDGSNLSLVSGNFFMSVSSLLDTISSGVLNFGTSNATTMTFGRSGQNMIINSRLGIGTSTPISTLHVNGDLTANLIRTSSNCSSTASPATCGTSSAGSVAMSTGTDTLVVNTTAVTADSQIMITEDSSLGARLGITCNTGTNRSYTISARSAGTSFTIKSSNNPVTNKACLSYLIVN